MTKLFTADATQEAQKITVSAALLYSLCFDFHGKESANFVFSIAMTVGYKQRLYDYSLYYSLLILCCIWRCCLKLQQRFGFLRHTVCLWLTGKCLLCKFWTLHF